MSNVKEKEFNPEELMSLIPNRFYSIIGKSSPQELKTNVKFNLNVDEQYKNEILFAFSYYEALNERQRRGVKFGIGNISVSYLLTWIGENNEALLDEIELMNNEDIPVIAWLENQLIRTKAMALSFDEKIAEDERIDSNGKPN